MNGFPTEADATKAIVKGVSMLILTKLALAASLYMLGRWARKHA